MVRARVQFHPALLPAAALPSPCATLTPHRQIHAHMHTHTHMHKHTHAHFCTHTHTLCPSGGPPQQNCPATHLRSARPPRPPPHAASCPAPHAGCSASAPPAQREPDPGRARLQGWCSAKHNWAALVSLVHLRLRPIRTGGPARLQGWCSARHALVLAGFNRQRPTCTMGNASGRARLQDPRSV